MVASFAFGVSVSSGWSSWIRGKGVSGDGIRDLKAWVLTDISTSWEKRASRSNVVVCVV